MTSLQKQALNSFALGIAFVCMLVFLLINEVTRWAIGPLLLLRGAWHTSGDLATFADWITRDNRPPAPKTDE